MNNMKPEIARDIEILVECAFENAVEDSTEINKNRRIELTKAAARVELWLATYQSEEKQV